LISIQLRNGGRFAVRDVYAAIEERLRQGRRFAAATLVSTTGSMLAPLGTSLIVEEGGSFAGNIGAGCHERTIIEEALVALHSGNERTVVVELQDEVFDGSGCGAVLTVVVWVPESSFARIARCIASGVQSIAFQCGSFAVRIAAKRQLLIVGATALASEVARAARECDFHVTMIDPRPPFITNERHPHADRLIVAWPEDVLPALLDERSALLVLAHDSKIALPAIRCGLESEAQYVGALGSRRSQSVRRDALRQLGFDDIALSRLRGPVGLDLGATTCAQTACSIVAEVLAVMNGRNGASLTATVGSIHSRSVARCCTAPQSVAKTLMEYDLFVAPAGFEFCGAVLADPVRY
jgi:xanthine dehydrogenase accessory factor